MSWQEQLHKLVPLTDEEAEIFAPPREMEAAISSYNRALANLRADSADIAQIALRKLVIQYPLFGPAGLLYAVCLAEQHRFDAAVELISRARLAGLRSADIQLANALEETIQQEQELTEPTQSHTFVRTIGGSPILEKTRKAGKTKMATRKEVLEVVRNGDRIQQEETFVADEDTPGQRLRRLVMVAGITLGIALVALLGFLGTRAILARDRSTRPDDQARLDFLLERLNGLSASDEEVALILEDYTRFITPETSQEMPSTEQTASITETTPHATTEETTQPIETTAALASEPAGTSSPTDLLTQVYSEYQAALILAETDPVTAAENLLKMSQASASLDPALQSPAVPMSVETLNENILASLDKYRATAAETLRTQGSAAYDSKDYQTSLDFYLRAYALNPLGYGGGIAYYCGRNYQALGEYDLAKPYYELVVANYSGRDIGSYARIRLSEMGFAAETTTTTTTEVPAESVAETSPVTA